MTDPVVPDQPAARPVLGSWSRCRRGHDMTPDNMYIKPDRRVECRQCRAEVATQTRRKGSYEIPGMNYDDLPGLVLELMRRLAHTNPQVCPRSDPQGADGTVAA